MIRSIAKYVVVSTDLSEGAMAVAKAVRTDRQADRSDKCLCVVFILRSAAGNMLRCHGHGRQTDRDRQKVKREDDDVCSAEEAFL